MSSVIENNVEILLKRIDLILNDFENFDKPILNDKGDIIIRNKITRRTKKENSILANVFKQIIADDIKKNRV
tara:strand:+ start:702 stop:917 length:216 start_codon:yes stop_codon:yes gene_type:complete